MKNWTHLHWTNLLVAAVVAALIGAGSAFLSSSKRGAEVRGGASDATASDAAALEQTLAELRAEQQALAARVAALANAAPATSPAASASRAPAQNLDHAIAAYMAKQLTAPAAGSARRDDALAEEDPEIAAIADRILSGALAEGELDALWQKLRDEKRIDAVVAEIERQAENSPNNPDLQAQLGDAYIQKLFDVGIGPMASVWGEKADRAYDRALELDDTHWDARFNKALSLSNWPTFLGKQGEAVHQFEILMDQQERAAPVDDHAMTYLFLGNMYDQNGDREKALATWRRGAERFPENGDLLAKTGGR